MTAGQGTPRGKLFLRGAKQLLTFRGPRAPRRGAAMRDIGVIADGAVLIDGGLIRQVGLTRRLENVKEARGAVVLDVTGKVVMPGFIDACTQLISPAPDLDAYERDCLGAGRLSTRPMLMRSYTAARMEMEARKHLRYFLRSGTTSLDAGCGFGLDQATEFKALRTLDRLDRAPLDITRTFRWNRLPPEFAGQPTAALEWFAGEVLPALQQKKLAEYVEFSCGQDAFDEAHLRVLLRAAGATNLGTRVQLQGAGLRPALAEQADTVSGDLRISGDAAADLAASNAIAILAPCMSLQPGQHEPFSARPLLDRGVAVALCSGYRFDAAPVCCVPLAISLACAFYQFSPAEALTAATVNAACATGMINLAGSIEPGKQADLLIFDTADYREIPRQPGTNLLAGVVKMGEMIYPRMRAA